MTHVHLSFHYGTGSSLHFACSCSQVIKLIPDFESTIVPGLESIIIILIISQEQQQEQKQQKNTFISQ